MEPLLKYRRLCNGLKDVLENDTASCLAVHKKVNLCYSSILALVSLRFWFFSPAINIPVDSPC